MVDFVVGETFRYYEIKVLQSSNYIELWKGDFRNVLTAQKKLKKILNTELKYYDPSHVYMVVNYLEREKQKEKIFVSFLYTFFIQEPLFFAYFVLNLRRNSD